MGKFEMLVGGAAFDVCSHSERRDTAFPLGGIYRAKIPGKGPVCLFKVLMTNVCQNDCAYCVNRSQLDIPRSAYHPEELANVFMELRRKDLVKGLFLTSGIAGNANRTMALMIDTVQILRARHRFTGYIHLKILPGASFDTVEEACRLADRVSLNVESPGPEFLGRLSARKHLYPDIMERINWIRQIREKNGLVPSGQTTQYVVGAAGETDRHLIRSSLELYEKMDLKRVYFSAYEPKGDPRLEGVPPTPLIREFRLYQTDWLLRVYKFDPAEVELALNELGNLPLSRDPKMEIARKQPWLFPIDVNKAGYDELLHVPGIGPLSARRIIEARKERRISSVEQLRKMKVRTNQSASFVWFTGMLSEERQSSFLPLLDEAEEKERTAILV